MKKIQDMHNCIKVIEDLGELIRIKKEINPEYEVAGITKMLDDGPALLFEKIKGYDGAKIITNIFSRRERFAKLFGSSPEYLCKRFYEAYMNPIPPKVVSDSPCRKNIIDDVDILNHLPVLKYTPNGTPLHIISGGIFVFKLPNGQFHISYHRMAVVDKDVTTIGITPGRTIEGILLNLKKSGGRLPVTITIGASPAILAAACASFTDKLGVAGNLQNSPVELCKAETVDSYYIANSEFVLEGYIDTTETAWEHPDAIEHGKEYFFPEYQGYAGHAYKTFVVKITRIMYRNEPIYFAPLADSMESVNLVGIPIEANVYKICREIDPNLIDTVVSLRGMRGFNGCAIRVNKRWKRQEGRQKMFMHAAVATSTPPRYRFVVVVDSDVDVTNADDVLWAIINRCNFKEDIEVYHTDSMVFTTGMELLNYGVMIDATVPLEYKEHHMRGLWPKVELSKFLEKEDIEKVSKLQSDYAKSIAQRCCILDYKT